MKQQEINLGDAVKVLDGLFKDKTGVVVGKIAVGNDFDDPYYEVEMQCEVPDKYKCRKTLIGSNNVIAGVSAEELEVVCPRNSQQSQRLIPKDYINQLYALQEKLTTLECECLRFTEWVINFTRDCRSVAVHFDNEYLTLAAQKMVVNLRPKTAEEKEAEKRVLRDAANEAFNKAIGRDLKK